MPVQTLFSNRLPAITGSAVSADFADILKYSHLSQSANVRHAGRTGDTDGYDPSEVLAEARRVALRAAMDAYEKNE